MDEDNDDPRLMPKANRTWEKMPDSAYFVYVCEVVWLHIVHVRACFHIYAHTYKHMSCDEAGKTMFGGLLFSRLFLSHTHMHARTCRCDERGNQSSQGRLRFPFRRLSASPHVSGLYQTASEQDYD